MSLRARLVLSAAYLLSVIVIALVIPLALNIDRRASSEFAQGVLGNASILAARISDTVARLRQTSARGERQQLARPVRETAAATGARVVVVDGEGRLLDDSARIAARGVDYATTERPEFSVALFQGRIDSRDRFSDSLGEELLLVTVPVVHNGRVIGAVRVSEETGDVAQRVRRSQLGLLAVAVTAILAGLGLAWVLATSVARPVRRLEDAAVRLGAGDLNARARPEGPDEIATLARSFNRTAEALSANLIAQRDFLANASHQLRTPLTGLGLRLEAIRERGGEAGREAAKAEAELRRLSELVDDLLQLARAASVEAAGAPVDLADVARRAADRWAGPAREREHSLKVEAPGEVTAWADATDVSHVIDNLVENAIRYCPQGCSIVITVNSDGGRPSVTVSDDGPGIAAEDRSRVFERFYRGATGRRAGPGSGLGLAVVAELVGRWGGEVRLLDGPGTTIQALFPRVSSPSAQRRRRTEDGRPTVS